MAGAFQASAFQNSAFQTDGSAIATPAGVKHHKRRKWRVKTPEGTFDFGSEGQATAFIGREQRRLAAERKQAATVGVFLPKVRLEAVRTDLEPDAPYITPAALKVAEAPQFIAPQIDYALAAEMLSRQDDEDAMALIMEYL